MRRMLRMRRIDRDRLGTNPAEPRRQPPRDAGVADNSDARDTEQNRQLSFVVRPWLFSASLCRSFLLCRGDASPHGSASCCYRSLPAVLTLTSPASLTSRGL